MERYSINRSDKKWLVMKQSTILKKEITFSSKHHECDFIYSYHFKMLLPIFAKTIKKIKPNTNTKETIDQL